VRRGGSSPPARRLIAVCRADRTGRYDWLPAHRPGDVTVTLDGIAAVDLAARRPLPFDELETWEQRNAAEHRIGELLAAVRSAPAVAAIELEGHRLIDFAEYRLRGEIACLLRGWTLARAVGAAEELTCDPFAPAALAMGARAALGLDPAAVPYALPPELPGSRIARAAMRPIMRGLASVSRPATARIAAVATGKLMLAMNALSDADLRSFGLATMPFPGLDYGNSAVLSLRRRLPMLATFGPRRALSAPTVGLPERLDLGSEPRFDRAVTILVARLLSGAASDLTRAVRALEGLERARELRALLLPSAAYGASRLLIGWAHDRGVRVGAMQHGIYSFREFDGGDRLADVVFAWGEGTAEQVRDWPTPRPEIVPVGVPGLVAAVPRPSHAARGMRASATNRSAGVPRNALIATSNTVDTPIAPTAFCESFVEVLAPGLSRLAAAGVRLALRPHPAEDPARYRRLLAMHGLDVEIVAGGSFQAAAAEANILISSASSVAFEAAAVGLPVLMWLGSAPQSVREQHLVAPWVDRAPGLFERAEDFSSLVEDLLERPARTLAVAEELARRLARYAQPFDPAGFGEAMRMLAA
jgi:hypothetical protein